MKTRRAIAGAMMLLGTTLLGTGTAAAAAPANDDYTGAFAVDPLPFSTTQDTTEAVQTDAFEATLNTCGAPLFEHGVWFTGIGPDSGVIGVDISLSDFSAGAYVFQGLPAPESVVGCAPGMVTGSVTPGEPYYVLAFGDGLSSQTSGNLSISISEAAPPPAVDLTVAPYASVNRSGVVTLKGTVTCTSEDGSGILWDVYGQLTQRVGRMLIRGWFYSFVGAPCDGTATPWEAQVVGDVGIFKGGKAASVTFAFGCTTGGCSDGYVEKTIQIRGGKR